MKAPALGHPSDRFGLRCAAKVAGMLWLGGCVDATQGASAAPSTGPEAGQGDSVQAQDSATGAPVSVAEAAPVESASEPPAQEVPTGEDSLEACRDLTASSFSSDRSLLPGADKPAVLACCDKIAKWMDAQMQEAFEASAAGEASPEETARATAAIMDWPQRDACCVALEWRGSSACTPWGPPAPAAMSASERAASPSCGWTIDWCAQAEGLAVDLPRCEPGELADFATNTWRARMVNETVSSRVFESLSEQMRAAGFDSEEVETVRAFAQQERHHGRLCAAVVHALGGRARAHSDELPVVPQHAQVDRRQAVLRNLMSVSCLSETVAVALISAERDAMPAGALRDLLAKILADEVSHARFGWRLLERELAASPERKADLLAYLPVALDEMMAFELAHMPASEAFDPGVRWPSGACLWGLCSGARARALLQATVDEVIAPRLARLLA